MFETYEILKKKLVTIIYFFKININPIYEINKKILNYRSTLLRSFKLDVCNMLLKVRKT